MIKRHHLFALAINSVRRLANTLIGVASNADAAPISSEDNAFSLLAPYGDTVYWQQEPDGSHQKYTQRFQRPQADAMVAAFNATLAKKGASYKGLPIYKGHPDADHKRWPDESRLGGVMALEARDTGLFVKPAWNSAGRQNREEGFLVFPSPAWLYDRDLAKNSRIIEPNELQSVGLTNSPRIQDVIPWVNSADPDATRSQAEANAAPDPKHKKMLCSLLDLGEDASDEDIQKAHDAHMDVKDAHNKLQAAKDKLQTAHDKLDKAAKGHAEAVQALQEKNTAANAEAARYRNLAVGTLLDVALNAGRITAGERPDFETAFNADFDAAANNLKEKKPALNTQSLNLRPVAPSLETQHGRALAFNARLAVLQQSVATGGKGLKFDAAIAYMRTNPEDKTLLDAMNAASH